MQCTGWTGADAGQAAHARCFHHDHRPLWMASFSRILRQGQQGLEGAAEDATAVVEIGGKGAESNDHLVTESLIRGFYIRYRDIMGFERVT